MKQTNQYPQVSITIGHNGPESEPWFWGLKLRESKEAKARVFKGDSPTQTAVHTDMANAMLDFALEQVKELKAEMAEMEGMRGKAS